MRYHSGLAVGLAGLDREETFLPTRNLLVLGGGAAGLATAFHGVQKGWQCQLLEKTSSLGGLCQTMRFGEHRYDLGAHRFHDRNPEVTAQVRRLLGGRLHPVTGRSKIYRWGRFIDFPPTPLNLLLSMPTRKALAAGRDLVSARFGRRPATTFEDYAVGQFGRTLAQTLLIDYSEKLWGLPAHRLSPSVATRRLSGMSVKSLLIELLGLGVTTHLDGEFLYPDEGFGAITEALSQQLPPGVACTDTAVNGLEHDGRRILAVVHSGGRLDLSAGDFVVSTLPLGALVRFLRPPLAPDVVEIVKSLRFRHIRLVYFRLDQERFSCYASIYFPDRDLCLTRLSEPKNRATGMSPADETGIAVEVPCFAGDAAYELSDSELAERIRLELEDRGLLESSRVLGWRHHLLPNAYPVYDLGFQEKVQGLARELERFENLRIAGRQGRFFYSHLHDQLRMGRDIVDSLGEI